MMGHSAVVAAGGEPWDVAQERSRNLDILGDVLGPAARGNRPLFK